MDIDKVLFRVFAQSRHKLEVRSLAPVLTASVHEKYNKIAYYYWTQVYFKISSIFWQTYT